VRRSYHHGDLRKALLDATLAIVRGDGPAAGSWREVATRAGVSEAGRYHHFQSKSHLLLAAAADGYRALGERMAATGERATTARERLAEIGAAYVRFALDEPGYFRLLFGAHVVELVAHPDADATKQAGRTAAQHLREGVAAFVAESRTSMPPRDLERLVWSQIHGLAWLVLEQELRPEPSTDDAVALARSGIDVLLSGVPATARPRAKTRRPRASV